MLNIPDQQNLPDFEDGLYGFQFDKVVSKRCLSNTKKTPIIGCLVQIASMKVGCNVIYVDHAQTMEEMDWCDRAEAFDNGYSPSPEYGSLWIYGEHMDLGPFWILLEEYEKNPPIRQINQLKAIEHLEDRIMYYEENMFDEMEREYYNQMILPKLQFLRRVKAKTRENLSRGI